MAYHCTDEDAGTRTLQATATIRQHYSEGVTEETYIVPGGATSCKLTITLAGICPLNFTPFTNDAGGMAWWVEWREDGSTGTRRVALVWADEVDISVTASGTMKQYEEIAGYGGAGEIEKLVPATLRDIERNIYRKVDEYHFTMVFGGVTYEWDWPADDTVLPDDPTAGIREDIVVQAVIRATDIISHTLEANLENEYFVPESRWDMEAHSTYGMVWAEGTYSRSPGGVCEETRSFSHTRDLDVGTDLQYGAPGGTVASQVATTLGNGAFSTSAGIGLGISRAVSPQFFSIGGAADLWLQDSLGPYTVAYDSVDVKDIDLADRAAGLELTTPERHPRRIDHIIGEEFFDNPGDEWNYNGETDPAALSYEEYVWTQEDDVTPIEGLKIQNGALTVEYKGKLQYDVTGPTAPLSSPLHMEGAAATFIDTNQDLSLEAAQLKHGNLSIDGIAEDPQTVPEPAHPPWSTPAGDPYYDNIALTDAGAANRLTLPDALEITVPAAGALVPDPPLVFGELDQTWDDTNCTATANGTSLTIETGADVTGAEASCTNIATLAKHVRGARYLVISWEADVVDAEATLHLGGSSWDLVDDGTGQSIIDVCCPDACTVTADPTMQSIVPYEMSGSFDLPAGWGIGKLTQLKIVPKTINCEYTFTSAQFKRKAAADGGFCKLYVLPQSGPWNDTVDGSDFSWSAYSGGWIVNKARLVIDGAVVLEIPQLLFDGTTPSWYKLTDSFFALPLDDYGTPTEIPVNGVTVAAGTIPAGFWAANCLTGFLEGGIYEPDGSNVISVDLVIRPRYWNTSPDTGVLPSMAYQRFEGIVHGLAFTGEKDPAYPSSIAISNPDGAVGTVETQNKKPNGVGWFESRSFNTKGDASLLGAGEVTPVTVPLRNRMYSRVILTSALVPSTGIDACIDAVSGVMHIALIADDGLRVQRSLDAGKTLAASVLVTEAASPVNPCIFIKRHERNKVGAVWSEDATAKIAWSDDGFATREVATLMTGLSNLRVKVNPFGVMLAAGWQSSSGKIVAARSFDYGATWSALADVATADEQAFGLTVAPNEHGTWCVTFVDVAGAVKTYWSHDNGLAWAEAA